MKKTIPLAIATVTLLSLAIQVAMAQLTPPCWFYGTVSVEGLPAQDGLDVAAAIIGTNLTWTTKTKNGTYGWTQKGSATFYIPSDDPMTTSKDGAVDGDMIEFYVNGTKTKQIAVFPPSANLPDMKRIDLVVGSPSADNQPPSAVVLSEPSEIGENFVELAWSASPDEDFARYEICKSTSSEIYGLSIHSITDQQTTTFIVRELLSNTTYFFTIKVVDTGTLFAYSNQVQAKTKTSSTSIHGQPLPWMWLTVILLAVALPLVIILVVKRTEKGPSQLGFSRNPEHLHAFSATAAYIP